MSETPAFIRPLPTLQVAEQAWLGRCQFSFGGQLDAIPSLPAALLSAHPKRQAEYLAGRWCAEQAMRAVHPALTGAPLPTGADGAPCWPAEVAGSITHHQTHHQGQARALVASKQHYLGVGVDLEAIMSSARASKLERKILCPTESRQLDAMALSHAQRAVWISQIFSAKEALFKALFPLTGIRFYFQDAAVEDLRREPLQLTLQRSLSEQWHKRQTLPFQQETNKQTVLTTVLVPKVNPATA